MVQHGLPQLRDGFAFVIGLAPVGESARIAVLFRHSGGLEGFARLAV